MDDITAFLAKSVLFSVLPADALPAIARAATRVALAKGETLFEAGTTGDAVFLVRSGLLQIVGAPALGRPALGEVARRAPRRNGGSHRGAARRGGDRGRRVGALRRAG